MKKCESGRNKVEIFLLLYDHIIRNKSVRHEAEQLVAPPQRQSVISGLKTSDPLGALLPQQRSLLFCSLNSLNHTERWRAGVIFKEMDHLP